MDMFSKEGRQLLEGATRWADDACKLLDRERRKGDYRMLAQAHPAVRSYFGEVYSKAGPQRGIQLWAALNPDHARALIIIRHNYDMMGRLTESFDAVKLGKLTIDEIEGLLSYVEAQLVTKKQTQREIAGMSVERLQDALQNIKDELQRRRKEENAQQEGKAPITGALTEALTDLSRDIRGGNHGH